MHKRVQRAKEGKNNQVQLAMVHVLVNTVCSLIKRLHQGVE